MDHIQIIQLPTALLAVLQFGFKSTWPANPCSYRIYSITSTNFDKAFQHATKLHVWVHILECKRYCFANTHFPQYNGWRISQYRYTDLQRWTIQFRGVRWKENRHILIITCLLICIVIDPKQFVTHFSM